MDRDRWSSYPIASAEDELFLALLALSGNASRPVTVVASDGTWRSLDVRGSVAVEEPCDGKAAVVSRVELSGPLLEGERIEEDLWEVAADLLASAERKARRLQGAAVAIPPGERPHGLETVIDVTWGGTPQRYGIPAGSEREVEEASTSRRDQRVKTQPPIRTARLPRD